MIFFFEQYICESVKLKSFFNDNASLEMDSERGHICPRFGFRDLLYSQKLTFHVSWSGLNLKKN